MSEQSLVLVKPDGVKRGIIGEILRNLIHASGNPKEAEFEKKLWLKRNEIYSY